MALQTSWRLAATGILASRPTPGMEPGPMRPGRAATCRTERPSSSPASALPQRPSLLVTGLDSHEPDRLRRVVLDFDLIRLLVDRNQGRRSEFPLSGAATLGEVHLRHREVVLFR